jgi:hypothetical protein
MSMLLQYRGSSLSRPLGRGRRSSRCRPQSNSLLSAGVVRGTAAVCWTLLLVGMASPASAQFMIPRTAPSGERFSVTCQVSMFIWDGTSGSAKLFSEDKYTETVSFDFVANQWWIADADVETHPFVSVSDTELVLWDYGDGLGVKVDRVKGEIYSTRLDFPRKGWWTNTMGPCVKVEFVPSDEVPVTF